MIIKKKNNQSYLKQYKEKKGSTAVFFKSIETSEQMYVLSFCYLLYKMKRITIDVWEYQLLILDSLSINMMPTPLSHSLFVYLVAKLKTILKRSGAA